MAFWIHFVHLGLLSKLVSTFVTKKSQLYLEVSHEVSHMCHTFVTNARNSSQNADTGVTLRGQMFWSRLATPSSVQNCHKMKQS